MRWKWIALSGVALILALAAAAYLFLSTYDYAKLKPRIERMVAEATGRKLTLSGPIDFKFGLSPALVVTQAALANALWASEPQMITAKRIEAKVRLIPLLFGDVDLRYLKLSGVDVMLAVDAAGQRNWEFTAPAGAGTSFGIPARLHVAVKDIWIANLKLTYYDEKTDRTIRFSMAELQAARQAGSDFLAVKLQAYYNGQTVELSGRIGRLQRIVSDERFPIQLAGSFAGATLNIAGSIGEVRALRGIDLNVRVAGKNLQELGSGIGTGLPQTDAFELSGHLAGSGRSPTLENISGSVSAGGAGLTLSGRVGNLTALEDLDLQLKCSGKDLAQVSGIVGQKLPPTDEFTVQGRLTGSAKMLSLQNIQGQARRGSLNLTARGAIGDLLVFQEVDLQLEAKGKDLAQAGSIIGQKLPQTDDFALQGRLTGSGRMLFLQNIRGRARRGSLSLTAEGAIRDLLAFQGVDLQLEGKGKDLAQAGAIIGQKLPQTDEITLQGRLTGSGRALALKDIRGRARRGSLSLTAKGAIGDLPAFRHVDLRLKGTGKDLAQAGSIIGRKLPSTDDFELEGRLTGSGRALALKDIRGRARRGSLSLTVDGVIGDVPDLRDMYLWMKGAGGDLAQAGSMIGQKLPPTDAFALQGYLTGSAKVLSLQDFRGRARRGSLNLEVSGAVKDLPALKGMDLGLKADGKQLAEIGPLVGAILPELGPFDFSAHLRGSARSFSLGDLTAVVDRSDFNGRAGVEFLRRPKITLVLESSLLDMTVLLKNLKPEEKEPGPAPGGIEGRLFSTKPLPLDFLKQVDADVTLNAKNIRARNANFEFGRLILTLENGDLNVDTLKATYKQTRISGNFHLYPESPPRVAAKFLVQDFDLGGLLRELRISDQVRSHLDIAVDVNSRGRSPRDLMAALDGSVGAVMGKGYLTHYLDLLSVGLTGKVVRFWGRHKRTGEIKCAVVEFEIKNGVADSRAFVFDTEAGVLTGEGDINLATEQVNFLLVPEPRYPSLMNFWTKLRISGPILDPKVRPDTLALLSKGAKALSALVIGPLGLLAPFVNLGAHKAHPCSVYSIGQ
jgi:uncharacterized protein involved in outer membrane biogenesis